VTEETGRVRAKRLRGSLSSAAITGIQDTQQFYEFGPFRLDPTERKLLRGNEIVALTPMAFDTLVLLVRNSGHLMEKDDLIRMLWPDTFVEEGSLSNNIFLLRKALGDDPAFIETVPRRGYRFVGAVRQVPSGPAARIEKLPAESPALVQARDRRPRGSNRRKVAVSALSGVVCALAILLFYPKFRPRAEPGAFAAVPFATYPGVEGCPAFSPDGSQIVFSWNGDPDSQMPRSAGYNFPGSQNEDLYVKVIGHENLVRLTHHPSEYVCAAWSPDGRQIAFHRMSGSDTGLYVIPALGGPERKLRSTAISHWFEVIPISWSPDGKWIAYVDSLPGDERRLFLLSVETLERREIPHTAECLADWLPAFSHDGKHLAYFCLQNPHQFENRLYTVATSGGVPRLLTTVDGWWGPGAPAWTADDKRLIFANPGYGTLGTGSRLYEVNLAEGALRKLPLTQNAYEPALSTKGDKLAFTSTISDGHSEIWRKDLLNPKSAATKLIPSTYPQQKQQYSPDGKHIAFESERSGIREVWVSDADGRNLVQISNFKEPRTETPRWSPDSQRIVFSSAESGRGEAYIADISERVPRKVVTNIPDISFPSWSHDGKWIYFLSNAANPGIYRCPADGGDAVLLTALPPGDLGMSAMESFDGETVYFTRFAFNAPVEMVSMKRPGTISVLKPVPRVLNLYAWTLVQGGIYFVPADAPKSVRYFDFKTEEIRQILDMDKDFGYGLSVSQDGHWILYSQMDEVNSNIMIVENFR
jgi:Tol biopolymer transport system component/DNA-binding winged helix-turn-helix (wHTH) protein